MTERFRTDSHEGRVYALVARRRSWIAAAAQRATQTRRSEPELAELARWEGEGGALPAHVAVKAVPRRFSMRFAMSSLSRHAAPADTVVEATTPSPSGKPASGFTGERNAGPRKAQRPRQNALKRPMNTHRGQRSR